MSRIFHFLLYSWALFLVLEVQAQTSTAGRWTDVTEPYLKQSNEAVVLLLDRSREGSPRSCPDCAKLDEFWNMAAGFYGTHRVYRGSCVTAKEWCTSRGLIDAEPDDGSVILPLLTAWNPFSSEWAPYQGPQHVESLKQWMDGILLNNVFQQHQQNNPESLRGRINNIADPVAANSNSQQQASFRQFQQQHGIQSSSGSNPNHGQALTGQSNVEPPKLTTASGQQQQLTFSQYQTQMGMINAADPNTGVIKDNHISSTHPLQQGDTSILSQFPWWPEEQPSWWPEDDALFASLRMTPLHAAAFGGDVQFVQNLMMEFRRQGTDLVHMMNIVNQRNRNGATPLMLAVQAGHLDMVQMLVQRMQASMTIADAQGATPLRAAVLLGNTDMVRELLKLGATMADDDYIAWSMSEVARLQGNEAMAELLHIFYPLQAEDFQEYHHQLQTSTMLPPGAELKTCPHPVNIEAARCHLVQCQEMPIVDAATMKTDEGVPVAFRTLGDAILSTLKEQTRAQRPTWKFRQAPNFYSTQHLPPDIAQTCTFGDPRCTVPLNWASACLEDDDVWPCLFGLGEGAEQLRQPCDCSTNNKTDGTSFTNRDVSLLLYAAILLDGNRTSPHLTPGPTPPAFSTPDSNANTNTITAVSVHIRAGDSCDVVNWGANLTSWALWPFQWTGVRGSNWESVQRFCVHPTVHLSALRGVLAKHPEVTTVLLATDSPLGVELFKKELSAWAPQITLLVNDHDRTRLDHLKRPSSPDGARTAERTPISNTKHWIENRAQKDPDFAAHAMHTALEDIRLLARGNLLIAAMCSNFARMTYGAMMAHNGRDVPVVSLDTCDVVCRPDELEFSAGLEFNHEPDVQ